MDVSRCNLLKIYPKLLGDTRGSSGFEPGGCRSMDDPIPGVYIGGVQGHTSYFGPKPG